MVVPEIKALIEQLDHKASLFRQCIPILADLDPNSQIVPARSVVPITRDLASIYERRQRDLDARGTENYGFDEAQRHFESHMGEFVQVTLVRTNIYSGYAFFNENMSALVAFPYARKDR